MRIWWFMACCGMSVCKSKMSACEKGSKGIFGNWLAVFAQTARIISTADLKMIGIGTAKNAQSEKGTGRWKKTRC